MSVSTSRNFFPGIILSSITALFLLLGSWILGKHGFFLMLNGDLGHWADIFFHYWTYLGDGVVWVIVLLAVLFYRKQYVPLIIAAILISTILTQVTKNYIFPGDPRPTYGLIDLKLIHIVPGVDLHTVNSFPSGHTATAFTIFLCGCVLTRNRWVLLPGFIYAALVGYSRIYLAQHFPLDVAAGIVVAIATIFLSLWIQKRWTARAIK